MWSKNTFILHSLQHLQQEPTDPPPASSDFEKLVAVVKMQAENAAKTNASVLAMNVCVAKTNASVDSLKDAVAYVASCEDEWRRYCFD